MVRFAWCDLHCVTRVKTLTAAAALLLMLAGALSVILFGRLL